MAFKDLVQAHPLHPENNSFLAVGSSRRGEEPSKVSNAPEEKCKRTAENPHGAGSPTEPSLRSAQQGSFHPYSGIYPGPWKVSRVSTGIKPSPAAQRLAAALSSSSWLSSPAAAPRFSKICREHHCSVVGVKGASIVVSGLNFRVYECRFQEQVITMFI